MTRANARELAVHLIYGRVFTGEEPEKVVSVRLDKEYYTQLSEENDIYAEGTKKVCESIAHLENAFSVIGGGDSASAAKQLGYKEKFSHVSLIFSC